MDNKIEEKKELDQNSKPTTSNNTNQQNKQGNGKKSLKWYQKFWNWIKGKKNESFNFDGKMNVEESG